MGNIDWLPIAELPEAFKDGRFVLIWIQHGGAKVARWVNGAWTGASCTPTHFAEINAPGG